MSFKRYNELQIEGIVQDAVALHSKASRKYRGIVIDADVRTSSDVMFVT